MEERRPEIEQAWARSAFSDFCEAVLLDVRPRGDVVRRVDAAADLFVDVARRFATASEVEAGSLRELFGAERLRRAEKAVAFLSERLSLRWHDVAEPPDRSRIVAVEPRLSLDALETLTISHDVFLVARQAAGQLSARSVKTYREARAGLLAFTAADRRSEPNERDVRRLLWAKPGLRASLGPFLTWLDTERGMKLSMPHRAARDNKKAEMRLIDDVRASMAELAWNGEGPRWRSMLAALTARLLAIPLEDVLLLRRGDVIGPMSSGLRWRGEAINLPAALSGPFERLLASGRSDLLFPGRTGYRPLSPSAVAHHRRRSGRGRRLTMAEQPSASDP